MKTPAQKSYKIPLIRRFKATWRDTLLLLKEFIWPLLTFSFVILGGGSLYYFWAAEGDSSLRYVQEAIYLVLGLTFFQPSVDFPDDWRLQVFFFLMPIIGLGLIAQGVAEFGSLFFNRRTRNKEWEMAVASTLKNHVILVGLGHLGFQTAEHLLDLQQDVVVIEQNPKANLIETVKEMGVTMIVEDANREMALEAAGINKAKTILLCTQNDSLNIQIAVKARVLNPKIKVVVRMFDNDFAKAIEDQFGFHAISASAMSAPAFAAAAAGVEISRPISIEGHSFRIARLDISNSSSLANKTISQLENIYNISIVVLKNQSGAKQHPDGNQSISEGDSIIVISDQSEIQILLRANGNYSK